MFTGCPGAHKIKEPKPQYVLCPHCKTEVELWSDEYRARCPQCQAWVYGAEVVTCLDWCAKAEECVGSAALAAYKHAKQTA